MIFCNFFITEFIKTSIPEAIKYLTGSANFHSEYDLVPEADTGSIIEDAVIAGVNTALSDYNNYKPTELGEWLTAYTDIDGTDVTGSLGDNLDLWIKSKNYDWNTKLSKFPEFVSSLTGSVDFQTWADPELIPSSSLSDLIQGQLSWENLSDAELGEWLTEFTGSGGSISGWNENATSLDNYLISLDYETLSGSIPDTIGFLSSSADFKSEFSFDPTWTNMSYVEQISGSSTWFNNFVVGSESLYGFGTDNTWDTVDDTIYPNLDTFVSSSIVLSYSTAVQYFSGSFTSLVNKSAFRNAYGLIFEADAINNDTYCNYLDQCQQDFTADTIVDFKGTGAGCANYIPDTGSIALASSKTCIDEGDSCGDYSDSDGTCISDIYVDYCVDSETCLVESNYTVNAGACSTYTSNEGTCMPTSGCDIESFDFATDCLADYPTITLTAGQSTKSNQIAYLLQSNKTMHTAFTLSGGLVDGDTIIGPKSTDPADLGSFTYFSFQCDAGDCWGGATFYAGMGYVVYTANGGELTWIP